MLEKMAYVRRMQFLKGNDVRMHTGRLTLVHAGDASVAGSVRRCDLDDPGGMYKTGASSADEKRRPTNTSRRRWSGSRTPAGTGSRYPGRRDTAV